MILVIYLQSLISPSLLLDSMSFMGRSMFFRSSTASYKYRNNTIKAD